MASRIPLPNLGPRTRKVLRVIGYIVLALVTFVLALQLTFPYDRIKAKLEEALSEKYVVTIQGVERGIVPGRVYFTSVALETRPAKPDDPVSRMFISRLEVDVRFVPLLFGAASVNLGADIGAGRIDGTVTISRGGTEVSFEGSDLQAQMLPMREAIGLPMSGMLEFAFNLDLPNEKSKSGKIAPNWKRAEGGARIACPRGCTFGDGKTKLKTKLKNARNAAFAADGIEFGTVTLKSLLAKVEIKTGQLTVTKFEAPSSDGTLHVDFAMELAPVFNESEVTGCLRFNGSQELLQREPKTFSAITATGAPLGPDNLFHIRLTDKFKDMKRLGQLCGNAAPKDADDSGGPVRPTLSVPPPDEPVRPVDAGIAPTFTPPTTPETGAPGSGAGSAVNVPVPGPDSPGSAAPGHAPEGAGSAADAEGGAVPPKAEVIL